jgi:hypothetical protein
VALLCLGIWIARRPEQLTRPYVWAEESFILRRYLSDGWSGALEPVQGFLVVPTNPLLALAAELSFVRLPWIAYVLATAVFATTILMLVLPESWWGGRGTRAAMALSLSLVPVDPEVFGVLLYSFWWTAVWPLAVLGWKRGLWAARAPALLVAGLSSPAGGALSLVFLAAFARSRRRRDAVGAAILAAGAAVQAILVATSERGEAVGGSSVAAVVEQVLRTGGLYELRWLGGPRPGQLLVAAAGGALLLFLFDTGVRRARGRGDPRVLLLALASLTWAIVSALPSPLITDPVLAGPRYYFLPYVAFGWALVHVIVGAPQRSAAFVGGLFLAVAALNLPDAFSRKPEHRAATLSWPEELRRCAAAGGTVVQLPVYWDGSTQFWWLDVTPGECRRMLG